MFELFTQGYSFLNLLSLLAFITTVGLFFCGIPICRQIWKRKDTKEISGAPFLMGILGGCCWMTYGYLKKDSTVLYVTGCQVILYSTYTVFYWIMTKNKLWITIKVVAVLSICASLILSVHFFGMKVFHPLGVVCLTLNIADFAAPLAGLKVVLRRGATSTLPLPLCIANFMVSTEWFIYGLLRKDFYLITPNGIGSALAFCQLFLFVLLPRKPGQKSLAARLFMCVTGKKETDLEDPTKDIVADDIGEDSEKKITRAQRWSQKMMTNVSTVKEELENVIHMVGTDQFAYKHSISNEDDSCSEKTNDSRKQSTVTTLDSVMSTPDTCDTGCQTTQEAQEAEKIGSDLRRMQSMKAAIEEREQRLKRAQSSPDITNYM